MAKELYVNGYYEASFMDVHTKQEVDQETEDAILQCLQSGEYIYGMFPPRIVSIDDLTTTLYEVVLDATDALSYEWNEL